MPEADGEIRLGQRKRPTSVSWRYPTPGHRRAGPQDSDRSDRHPEDIAAACVWLASEEAAWVTGQTIQVNGGSITT
jgi:NAD(P)-dependent dehydrogenase (short-subunit alcohol dehydrogenase family)